MLIAMCEVLEVLARCSRFVIILFIASMTHDLTISFNFAHIEVCA